VRLGVAPGNIEVIARGKREPVVPTADGVAEPRNRRVEVIVR
jgi:outer membrane protein OmpA-like peptidoglycan-associated protein